MRYTEIGRINKDGYLCVREGSTSCYSMSCEHCVFADSYICTEESCSHDIREDGENVCFIEPYKE